MSEFVINAAPAAGPPPLSAVEASERPPRGVAAPSPPRIVATLVAALLHVLALLWLILSFLLGMPPPAPPDAVPVAIIFEPPKEPEQPPARAAPPAAPPVEGPRSSGSAKETTAPPPEEPPAAPPQELPSAPPPPEPSPSAAAPSSPAPPKLEKPAGRPTNQGAAQRVRPGTKNLRPGPTEQSGDPYLNALRDEMAKHRYYPPLAAPLGLAGTATFSMLLDRSGRLLALHLDRSSGAAMLDRAAEKTIRDTAPYPPPPADFPGDPVEITIEIRIAPE